MIAVIRARWNSVIPKDAVVFVLGDFFWNPITAQTVIDTLHGEKILLIGNHDRQCVKKNWFRAKFLRVTDMLMLDLQFEDQQERQLVHLSHYPMAVWDRSHYGSYHLHGHTHGGLQPQLGLFRLDVGMDCHEFRPLSALRIRDMMRELQNEQ